MPTTEKERPSTEEGTRPFSGASGPRRRPPRRPGRIGKVLLGARAAPRDPLRAFSPTRPKPARPSRLVALREKWQSTTGRLRTTLKSFEPVGADAKLAHAALVLSAVGLSLIAFLGYVFVFTGLQEQRTQHQLLELFDSSNLHLKSSLLTGAHLSEGQPAALLEIPAIGLHQVVVKGSSATDLLEGPGLMPDTAVPGTKGNAVIAGRRSTAGAPFGRILDLRPDDRITVVTALGSFTYKVVSVGTAVAGSTDPISPSTQAKLTLVTSNPPILATGRAYVVSRLVSPAARAPVPRAFPSEAERGLSGDPSALLPAALWGVVFVGALFLTVGAYRRWNDKIWAIYLLSTPIVIAVALVCFENLLRLLPATL